MECLICGGLSPSPRSKRRVRAYHEKERLLDQGSLTIFLLTQLLDIPSKDVETLLTECGHPFTWAPICDKGESSCAKMIEKGMDLVRKLRTLSEDLAVLKGKLKAFLTVKREEDFEIYPEVETANRIRNLVTRNITQEEFVDEGDASISAEDKKAAELEEGLISGYQEDRLSTSSEDDAGPDDSDWNEGGRPSSRISFSSDDSRQNGDKGFDDDELLEKPERCGDEDNLHTKKRAIDSKRISYMRGKSRRFEKFGGFKCMACGIKFPSRMGRNSHADTCPKMSSERIKRKRIRQSRKKVSLIAPDPGVVELNRETVLPGSTSVFQDILGATQIKIPEDGKLSIEDEDKLCFLSKEGNVEDFPCPKCSKVLGTFLFWRNHLWHCFGGVTGYVCPHCELPVGSLHVLDKHVFSYHFEKEDLRCQGCDIIFLPGKLPSYKQHISKVDPNSPCLLSSNKCDDEKCSAVFPTLKAFESHKQIRHPQEIEKPFRCSQCPARFCDASGLRNHRNLHEAKEQGKREYMCDKCGSTFTTKSALKSHETIVHATEKPFICDKCEKAFVTRARLRRHFRQTHEK